MASINTRRDKNGNLSFLIRVYRGYDSSGKRLKPYSMTWKPPAELTERQIEKELTKQAARDVTKRYSLSVWLLHFLQ